MTSIKTGVLVLGAGSDGEVDLPKILILALENIKNIRCQSYERLLLKEKAGSQIKL